MYTKTEPDLLIENQLYTGTLRDSVSKNPFTKSTLIYSSSGTPDLPSSKQYKNTPLREHGCRNPAATPRKFKNYGVPFRLLDPTRESMDIP